MTRSAITVNLRAESAQVYTGGSKASVKVSINVHKPEATLGNAFATLICEERALACPKVSEVHTELIPELPHSLFKGLHNFVIVFEIPETVDQYPTTLRTSDKNDAVGIYWLIKLEFQNMSTSTGSTIIPIYPARPLSNNTWTSQVEDSDETEMDARVDSMQKMGYLILGPEGDPIGKSNNVARSCDKNLYSSSNQEVGRYSIVSRQIPFIISKKEEAETMPKNKRKILPALFGENYRLPDKNDLGEVQIRAMLCVPRWGVFQSPHKAGMRLYVRIGRDNSVVLKTIKIKLLANTKIKGTDRTYQTATTILDHETDIVCSKGDTNLTNEFSDLEIPTACESTETDHLQHRYMIRVTLVFHALHLSNMSRWLTIVSPVTVLPSIIKMPAESPNAPPPYHA